MVRSRLRRGLRARGTLRLPARRLAAKAGGDRLYDCRIAALEATSLARVSVTARHSGSRTCELSQHEVQDAAVAEIVELVERIDRRAQGDRALLAARISDSGLEPLHRLDLGKPAQAHGLVTLEVERSPRRTLGKHERKHTHADQVRAVDALEALGDHCADAQEPCALGGPVAR